MEKFVRVLGIGESVRVPKTVRASNGKGRIFVSTGKRQNLCDFQEYVESVRVPETGRIGENTERLFGPVPEKVEYL